MKKILPLLLGVLIFAGCSKKTLLDEEHSFEGATWNRFLPETFDLAVKNIENYYNIDLTVVVDTLRYRYSELPVMMILKAPGGEERQFYGTVTLKGKSQATGRIRSYFSFNTPGTHRLEVSQITSQYDLEGIRSISLSITKAKVDYDL